MGRPELCAGDQGRADDDQVTYRLLTGQWRRAAWGVYVVAGAPDRWEQRVMVACLAGPAGTVASHLTAAAYDADGTFVARADVGIRELKVLSEYDSDEHHGPRCWIADDSGRRGWRRWAGW